MTALRTERLLLRELNPDSDRDADFMLRLLNDPGWRAGIGPSSVSDLAGAAAYIERACASSYREHGHGMYGVELLSTGELVGLMGLVRRESLEGPDLGFAFLREHCRQGFAVEAGRAALADANSRLGLTRVFAITTESNAGSLTVLDRLGFERVKNPELQPGAKQLLLFSLELHL